MLVPAVVRAPLSAGSYISMGSGHQVTIRGDPTPCNVTVPFAVLFAVVSAGVLLSLEETFYKARALHYRVGDRKNDIFRYVALLS